MTAKRFKPSDLGDNVSVPVPDMDRVRIGTKHGVLKQSFVRSQIIPSKGSFLSIVGPELDPCGTLNVILGSKITRYEMGLDFVVTNKLLGSVSQKILISSEMNNFSAYSPDY